MKKLFLFSLTVLVLMVGSATANAAESVSITGPTSAWRDVYKVTFTVTTASDGSLTATATNFNIQGWVCLAVTNPGGTSPTADYDITLDDSEGADVFGGALADRSASKSEQAVPATGSTYGSRFVEGTLTIGITNNSVDSATFVLILYFYR